jgi:hypothetical protein
MSDWQEAGNNTESWKPENEGDTIQGLLTQVKENVGINNSKVYMIEQEGAEEATSVWGSTVLDTKFQEIPVGSEVKIEYLGQVKGKGPKPYKDFKVLYKPAPSFEN